MDILHVDDDLVVVNKPPSIPVHPSGRFRVSILAIVLIALFPGPLPVHASMRLKNISLEKNTLHLLYLPSSLHFAIVLRDSFS